ncbi:hypothetical protein [Halococcoides cellulosivorans]|uniref:hypothetical protein n=1 Tax=Halococcoides cellulosivorans TaxID=1679096 RepID=UPI00131F2ED5|nr:hypothetical protein [Halococcoides cellulosivorans]
MTLELAEWVMRVTVIGMGLVILVLQGVLWYRLFNGDFGPRTLLGEAREGYREALDEE